MKRHFLIFILLGVFLSAGLVQAQNEVELFERAKLLIFDRQWDQALKVLEQFMERFQKSEHYPLALLYKGKCLEEKKLFKKALDIYTAFLKISRNENLKEEATIAIIDVNFNLYKKGYKSHLKKIGFYLKSINRSIRYYAAFKLSYADEKEVASKAVPVLKRMITREEDEELRDRAKIALMRINPDYLRDVSREEGPEAKLMYIQVYDKKLKKITFSLTIPFMFGKLALESIPQKDKNTLKKKGYDLDLLLKKLIEKRELLRVDDEDTLFKIWIE